MTMTVHDACEAWAEGRLPIERALELTGAADVGELLIICYQCDVPRPLLTGPPTPEADVVVAVVRSAPDVLPERGDELA